VAQQRLLLQLLQLLRAGEVEGVRPQVRPRVDEGWAQRLSCEGVHERGLGHARGHGRTQRRRLGLADLRVGLSELEPDGLRQVGVEPHSLLQVLLGRLGAGPAGEGDEAHRGGGLAVLAGHLQQRALVPLICSK